METNWRVNHAWWMLRVGLGLAAFLAGLDKFFNILADWGSYMSPLAARLLPVSTQAFMHLAGLIEMAAGLLVLAGFTRLGGYLVMAWLLLIAGNLVTTGRFFDVAVRDIEMAIGACVLARLTEVRQEAAASSRRRVPQEAPMGWQQQA